MKTTYKFLNFMLIASLLMPSGYAKDPVLPPLPQGDGPQEASAALLPPRDDAESNDSDNVFLDIVENGQESEDSPRVPGSRSLSGTSDEGSENLEPDPRSQSQSFESVDRITGTDARINPPMQGSDSSSTDAQKPAAIGANSCIKNLQNLNCNNFLKGKFEALAVPTNFEDPAQCAKFLDDKEDLSQVKSGIWNSLGAERVCRAIANECSNLEKYALEQCITEKTAARGAAVVLGAEKCVAIYDAASSTTEFEEGATVGQDPVTCKDNKQLKGYAFDYPSCTSFIMWYNGLKASEMGLGLYNEADKTMTGMKAQSDMAKEIQKGNGQTAGIEGAKKSTLAAADAESRNKIFFASKGVAITSQLMMFVTKDNIADKCSSSCCQLFEKGKIKANFFPNANVKSTMIAEVIKAGGAAVAAALKEAALKKQAALMKAAAAQLAPPDDNEEGFMKFCQQFPQDVRCLGPGNRLSVGGNGYGSNIAGQNFGLGDLGAATTDDFNTETIKPGSGPTAAAPVGGIGTFNKAAADAKDIFNAPPAARAGGAPPAGGGAGGGVGANASANGLSNDPGLQEEKKEDPLKVTSKTAKYDGGAGYNGGGWRDGGAKKPAGAENPFAAMFNKNKGRDIAAAKEIDSPASDLFTKISNRYGEVQKRKGLMEAADTNIR